LDRFNTMDAHLRQLLTAQDVNFPNSELQHHASESKKQLLELWAQLSDTIITVRKEIDDFTGTLSF
jgi:hypothetical protein